VAADGTTAVCVVPGELVVPGWLAAGDCAGEVLPPGVGETVAGDGAGVGGHVREGDGDGLGEWEARCGRAGDGAGVWLGWVRGVLGDGDGPTSPAVPDAGRTYR